MEREPNKRPRRTPLSSEEVAQIIAHRKRKELLQLHRLKKSTGYKVLNVFNIACIFIYLEIVLCFYGPCHYDTHLSANTIAHYGTSGFFKEKFVISDLDVVDANGSLYKFIINENIKAPGKSIHYLIGKDFLLQKELKAYITGSDTSYRLFSASPVLFLSVLVCFISFFGFIMNLNENAYTLAGLATLNVLTMLGVVLI